MKKINRHTIVLICYLFFAIDLHSQVTVYSEQNYQGTSRVFNDPGDFRITFDIKSIRVTPGYMIIMAKDAPSGGFCPGQCKYWKNVSGSTVIGHTGCGLRIIRVTDLRNARLVVMVGTGADDLRKGSKAFLNIITHPGGTQSLPLPGAENGLDNGSGQTFSLPIPGILPHQILGMSLSYESGSSGVPFETTDNWDVKDLVVQYRLGGDESGWPILFMRSGNPVIRFTGNNKRLTMRLVSQDCSNTSVAD